MSKNNSNNLYDLNTERKRLEQIKRQRAKEKPPQRKSALRHKVALYGQVAFFLIMVALLMYQCRG